ncbi:DUF4184 family protein [Kineosporia babensis]|uniref:DUF4184 family protein n=1 Tax=Kineosporia babensis TaxID=499548 RepID=A0A9X1SSR5_9ACTN|nr:DUF4184 family protein [Kineosporia babensis]MCD5310962.1 DUF4184 family protein [Kineosporia babensis]
MPFTLIHPVAVLPLARKPLVPSALVAGALAPDLPYFVSLQWFGGDYNLTKTHEASSVLWFDPIIALGLFGVFHLVARRPLLALLPPSVTSRLPVPAGRPNPLAVFASLVIGAATHVGWDAACDAFGYGLSARLNLLSDLVGGALLVAWLWRWWRTTEPKPGSQVLPARYRMVIGSALVVVAGLAGLVSMVRNVSEIGLSFGVLAAGDYAARSFVIAAITALAAGFAVYCLAFQFRARIG